MYTCAWRFTTTRVLIPLWIAIPALPWRRQINPWTTHTIRKIVQFRKRVSIKIKCVNNNTTPRVPWQHFQVSQTVTFLNILTDWLIFNNTKKYLYYHDFPGHYAFVYSKSWYFNLDYHKCDISLRIIVNTVYLKHAKDCFINSALSRNGKSVRDWSTQRWE